MSNLLDDTMDDNPIDEDFDGVDNECLNCGDTIPDGERFCSRNCERIYYNTNEDN